MAEKMPASWWTGAQSTTTQGEMVWHNLWALVIILIIYYIMLHRYIILYYYILCILKYSFSHYIVTKYLARSSLRQEGCVWLTVEEVQSITVGGHGRKSLAGHIASTVGNQREQEVEPGYQISRLTPFSPAVIKSLPIQGHHLGTKCSNIQDY